MNYWLLKSEPHTYSIDDLKRAKSDHWDGVRNYQARNMMRDQMRVGDKAFFYHSNCAEPGIVGIMTICREAYPDFTAHDAESTYYDPKSSPEAPRWFMVDVKFERKLERVITLKELKANSELQSLALVKRGNRLSIMPVEANDWQRILSLE